MILNEVNLKLLALLALNLDVTSQESLHSNAGVHVLGKGVGQCSILLVATTLIVTTNTKFIDLSSVRHLDVSLIRESEIQTILQLFIWLSKHWFMVKCKKRLKEIYLWYASATKLQPVT